MVHLERPCSSIRWRSGEETPGQIKASVPICIPAQWNNATEPSVTFSWSQSLTVFDLGHTFNQRGENGRQWLWGSNAATSSSWCMLLFLQTFTIPSRRSGSERVWLFVLYRHAWRGYACEFSLIRACWKVDRWIEGAWPALGSYCPMYSYWS